MRLDEAIEVVNAGLPADTWILTPELITALKLLIEASKEVERLRSHIHYRVNQLLPGETKE